MFRPLLAAVISASLVACATAPTLFQPAAGPKSAGYFEYRIEPGRYRVTFRGGPGAPADQVADFALLRAADLAIAEGYDWFQVVDRLREDAPNHGPRLNLGLGGGSFGGHGGVGVGVGSGFDLGGGPVITSTLEVLMGRGARPTGVDAYDARSLRSTLAPRI